MDPVRIGLVGGGHWARSVHAPAIAAHPQTQLAGVWTRRPEVAAELAATYGTQAYASVGELIADVDAVAFAVPPALQAALARDAAAAGRHLICEKPLAPDVAAAREVVEAVTEAGVVSTMVLTLRHDPSVRDWLAGFPDTPAGIDTVGSARWLSGSLLGGPYSSSTWRADPGNGAVLDLGPHVIDVLETALGPVTEVDWARYDEPDLWRFGLVHDGGAHSTCTLSLRLPVDPSAIEFAAFGGVGSHQLEGRVADAVACYRALLDEFVGAVRGGPAPFAGVATGLHLQELVDQVRERALG